MTRVPNLFAIKPKKELRRHIKTSLCDKFGFFHYGCDNIQVSEDRRAISKDLKLEEIFEKRKNSFAGFFRKDTDWTTVASQTNFGGQSNTLFLFNLWKLKAIRIPNCRKGTS